MTNLTPLLTLMVTNCNENGDLTQTQSLNLLLFTLKNKLSHGFFVRKTRYLLNVSNVIDQASVVLVLQAERELDVFFTRVGV